MDIAHRNKSTDKQVIQDFFSDRIAEKDLTDHQMERVKRVRLCVSMLLAGKPNTEVVQKMKKEFPISDATAYIDLRITQHVFGSIMKGNKEMYRAMAIEMALADRQAAIEEDDIKGRNAATRNFIEAAGLKRDDPDMPDFSKLQPSLIVTMLPPGMEQKIDQLLQGGVVNLNDLPGPTPVTEDIEHEEINP